MGLNWTTRAGAGLTGTKRFLLAVAALKLMLAFGSKFHLGNICVCRTVGDVPLVKRNNIGERGVRFSAGKIGLLKLPLGGVSWGTIPWLIDNWGYNITGLWSSFKNATDMAKGSAICAIGMGNPDINLKISRTVEAKNILKLPRPTLLPESKLNPQCFWKISLRSWICLMSIALQDKKRSTNTADRSPSSRWKTFCYNGQRERYAESWVRFDPTPTQISRVSQSWVNKKSWMLSWSQC